MEPLNVSFAADFYICPPSVGVRKKGSIQAITFEKTDKEYVVGKFNQSKTLAKMLSIYLYNGELHTSRFHDELDELKHQQVIRASSTTLLAPGKACDLFRHIGLLLDSDRCEVRHICPYDASVYRTTDAGEDITWDTTKKKYIKWIASESEEKPVAEFHGHFRARGDKLETIDELLKAYNNPSPKMMVKDDLLHMNEVVVDWGKDSIIGIVGTKCVFTMSHVEPQDISDSKLKSDCLSLQGELEKQLSVSVPVFLYDHLKGDLKLFSDT